MAARIDSDAVTLPTAQVFGFTVVDAGYDEVVGAVLDQAEVSQVTVLALNPEKVEAARRDPQLYGVLRSADVLLPDGIGLVWAARRMGVRLGDRVTGVDLMGRLCSAAAERGLRVFLLGARPGVAERAAAELVRSYPGLMVVGTQHGYTTDDVAVRAAINEAAPDLLFVGLGSPRQEHWIAANAPALCARVVQGVGGSIDVLAGDVRRAPALWQRARLEWLYRLAQNPRRLRRQLRIASFVLHARKPR